MWVQDLEGMRAFYVRYFNGRSSPKYTNPRTGFISTFIQFEEGARLELMHRADIPTKLNSGETQGLTHLAMAVGSREAVNQLTEMLRKDGYRVVGEPRTTGDGYYESVVLDPEGNRLEITT
jgi:lactoylglutathione lyase